MRISQTGRSAWFVAAAGALALALVPGAAGTAAQPQAQKAPAAPRYVGSAKCKNCHNSAKTGEQYAKWKQEKHANAFHALASAEAKKLAQEKGIDDPQKAAQCVKCHATAAGEPDERLMKGFDRREGVQCESCHGPGEKHLKARMAAAAAAGDDEGSDDEAAPRQEIAKDELGPRPDAETCKGCHNEESPSFKPFCFKHRVVEIEHFDPRNTKRKAERDAELAAMAHTCKEGGQ